MKCKGIGLFLAIMAVAATATIITAEETRLLRYPAISSDRVAFVYAGDIWTVDDGGGTAVRLTTHPGDELFPQFSPDGKWIAFSGEYDGNTDVYVVPSGGGEPRRLTYHPMQDGVLGWTPDGSKVLFRSERITVPQGFSRLFLVSPDGGLPEVMPLPRGSLSSFSPDGKRIAYNPISREFRTWKRYRGGLTSYIGIYDLEGNTYEELPRVKANDLFPMWHGNGIYFISDRNRVMNLYRHDLDTGEVRKLTDHTEYDVKWPGLGPDAIVYENGGLLYRFDLATEKTVPVPVTVPSELLTARRGIRAVGDFIRSADISPGGKRAVFQARGELFTVPAEHGSVRNLTDSPGVHELNPTWSPDGKWVAYLSDRTGEYEFYLRPQKGGDEIRVTDDGRVYRFGPVWSPDSKKLMYRDKELRMWYVDIDEKKPVQIYKSDFRGAGLGSWSADSNWIAYARNDTGRTTSIYLYSMKDGKNYQVTDSFFNDSEPVFDPDGKHLFFLSERFFHPANDSFDWHFAYYNTTGIFAVTLKGDTPSPFAPRSDDEEPEDDKAGEDGEDDGEKGTDKGDKKDKKKKKKGKKDKEDENDSDEDTEEKKDEPEPVEIDLDGIGDRIVTVPVTPGTYFNLSTREGKLFYMSVPFEAQQAGRPGKNGPAGSLHIYDLEEREDKVLMSGINGYVLDAEGKKLLYAAASQYGIVDATPGQANVGEGALATSSLRARVEPREEWKQIFREAWRIERDFFYDPGMHGLDWDKIGKRYEALLPWVAHRSDLNYIIGDMIAELSTSHSYVGGGQMPQRRRVGVGMLAADFEADGDYYRFVKIYRGENWNRGFRAPLVEPGLNVKEGTYLLSVNGRDLRVPENPYNHFQGLAGETVELKVNDKPGEEGARTIMVDTIGNESRVRYIDWLEANRRAVDKATGGRVGYMHVPDTSIDGLRQFDKYLSGQLDKDAMIVDERYNRGGMIPDFYTEKLQRKLLNLISPREGKDTPWPPVAIYGPKVMIINERAGSGGDAFPWYFKMQKIGPLIGTTTWGGLVGISRNIPLMDGGMVTAPEIAFWSPLTPGEWIAENKGVEPDYEVRQRPDLVVAGHDPQLEKAIEVIMDLLEDYKQPEGRPEYPRGR